MFLGIPRAQLIICEFTREEFDPDDPLSIGFLPTETIVRFQCIIIKEDYRIPLREGNKGIIVVVEKFLSLLCLTKTTTTLLDATRKEISFPLCL